MEWTRSLSPPRRPAHSSWHPRNRSDCEMARVRARKALMHDSRYRLIDCRPHRVPALLSRRKAEKDLFQFFRETTKSAKGSNPREEVRVLHLLRALVSRQCNKHHHQHTGLSELFLFMLSKCTCRIKIGLFAHFHGCASPT